ncbi:MAG: hypothetical protein PHH13_05760, partial [Candidatus Peribacteraceae bacterium]|nr:hypothetical protein [Candidatus Peribacteraceae bacterium]
MMGERMEIRLYCTRNVSTESELSVFAYASARSLRGGGTTSTHCGGEERNHENRKNIPEGVCFRGDVPDRYGFRPSPLKECGSDGYYWQRVRTHEDFIRICVVVKWIGIPIRLRSG